MNFILDVLSYPFRRGGRNMLVMGSILFGLLFVVGISPTLGGMASLILMAYFCGIYFELLNLSTDPEGELFCFPDLSDPIEDVLLPFVQVVGVILIAFGPYIAWHFWGGNVEHFSPLGPISTSNILLVWGFVYFPMAMLATVLVGSLIGASPHIVLPGIVRSGYLYFIAIILLGAIFDLVETVLTHTTANPLLVIPVTSFLCMYVLMAHARTLGLLYQRREEELGWFKTPADLTQEG